MRCIQSTRISDLQTCIRSRERFGIGTANNNLDYLNLQWSPFLVPLFELNSQISPLTCLLSWLILWTMLFDYSKLDYIIICSRTRLEKDHITVIKAYSQCYIIFLLKPKVFMLQQCQLINLLMMEISYFIKSCKTSTLF